MFVHAVSNLEDGTFSIDYVRENVRGEDIHEPVTQLVTIEQTHNMMGGKVVPLEWIEELSKVCKEKKLKLHMDGARVFNAAEYLKVPMSRVVRDVDTVSFCLSKNLCCPAGSMLVGTKDFVAKARRMRKALGGGMRQVGFLAAAGHAALDAIVPLLGNDHRHTKELAEAIDGLSSDSFKVDIKNIHSNILMIKTCGKVTALELSNRLAMVKPDEIEKGICDASGRGLVIKSSCKNLSTLRFVLYHQINDELTQLAIMKVMHVMKELAQ